MVINPRTYPEIYRKSGIYMIKNVVTGEEYIGSSAKLGKRWSSHSKHLQRNIHCNPKLQSSYNKYGDYAFVFGVIEYVDVDTLFEKEQYYYDLYKPKFNLSEVAKSPFTGKKLTEAHKLKCSLALKGKNLGCKRSDETKALLREIRLKQDTTKLIQSIKNRAKYVIVWYNETAPILFRSISEVQDNINIGNKSRTYLNNRCHDSGIFKDIYGNIYKIEYA